MYMMKKRDKGLQRWSVAEARANLPKVFASAAREPQAVYRRNRRVAVVVSPRTFDSLEAERAAQKTRSLADAFAELRDLGGSIPEPRRRNRPNPFARSRR